MRLYHYSNIKTDKLKIDNFGYNYFTLNDKKISDIKRIFFYDRNDNPENLFNGVKYLYVKDINNNDIYDLYNDNDNLRDKFKYNGVLNIDKLLLYVKENYKGILYKINDYNIINLFIDITPDEIIEL